MSSRHILIVEDDEDILGMIKYNLEKEGFRVTPLESGKDAAAKAAELMPDIVLLDIMLPDEDGLEVLRSIRSAKETSGLAVIMLTARSREADKVMGLELGADDYITKPFSPRELLARIKAVMRRSVKDEGRGTLAIGDLLIDSRKHKATVQGEELVLTSTEFRLLMYLARHPGEVFTRERILDAVFGYQSDVYERTVDTHIKTLRKKLGPARDMIETVRGAGYRFQEI